MRRDREEGEKSQQEQQQKQQENNMASGENNTSKFVCFVVGGPGVGKGTLLDALATAYNFQPISTGDVLRAEVARGTELGKKIGEIQARAALVPPEVAVTLLKQEISSSKARGVLLDGFPRSKEQRDAWYEQLGAPTGVINLDCPESVMEERALGRAKQAAERGEKVRADDNIETLRKRFRTHVEQCMPVMEEMKTQLGNKFCNIDASKDRESVAKAARAFLATLQIHPVA